MLHFFFAVLEHWKKSYPLKEICCLILVKLIYMKDVVLDKNID